MIENINLNSLIRGRVDPYIYAFETNTVPNFLKVGDTYRPVEVRLDEWRKFYSDLKKKYEHIAKVDDNTYFRDYSVHDFLIQNGFRRIEKDDVKSGIYLSNEFFMNAKKENVEEAIKDIQKSFEKKDNRYAFYDVEDNLPLGDFDFKRDAVWKPRENQKAVIENFSNAVKKGRNNLLMFAVMRFGKSFTSLCCAKEMKAKLTVVVCGKTAVRLEWKENVQRPKILDGFEFIDSDSMSRNPAVISEKLAEGHSVVVFLTMQDLLGEDIKTRHADLFSLNSQKKLDLLIIDETHFGARADEFGKVLGTTEKKGYDESFDDLENQIKVFSPKVKLHLSGTPYRILLDNEFESDDIVGMVQYSDIINEKEKWDKENIEKDEWENPYYGFPQMIRFAFNLNESAKTKLADLKNNGYAYDLDELFSPESTSKADEKHNQFKYKDEVLDLLRAIDGSKEDENIFSFLNYDKIKKGSMCRHIVMVLPYCASCDAMENLLKAERFNNLNDYEIINIAGFDSEKIMNKPDYAARVKEKIEKFESEGKKTISLTVGKMLTGSTVKEWDTMIFLRNTSSPQDYDQAIFRLQSQYVKTIKSEDGKIIKQDMKPQTILVDFDPVRMYTLQHKKSLIANINKSERGNEVLETKLKRELEIAPIIFMNHSKLGRVEAQDIVDTIRNYNANKSMMDETFDIEIDQRIFEDESIRSIIEKQPEVTAKGIKFDVSAYGSEDDGDDIDTPETQTAGDSEPHNTEKKDNAQNEEDDVKALASKLQGYYFKLLLFAFISEKDEKSVSDIIFNIENDTDGKRIGKNLQINVKELRLVRDKINPQILSYLEDKIQNINQLGKEISPDKIGIALKKMSRLSVSEVVTPDNVAMELVNNLPDDICASDKFLDIASKTGEFANALLQKYGSRIKNNVFSIPTSGVTYECTRKIYKLLGLPVENIYSDFTSYDLIDTTKNEEILKELKDMNFDAIIGNPPYQVIATGDANGSDPIYHLFIDAGKQFCNRETLIHPARFLFNAGKTPKDWNQKVLNDDHFKVVRYWANSSQLFPDVDIKGGVAITHWDNKIDFGKIGTFVAFEELRSILKKVKNGEFKTFADLVYPRTLYRFTDELYKENPWAKERPSKGHLYDMSSNVFDLFTEVFFENKPNYDTEFVQMYGLAKKKRAFRWVKRNYIKTPDNFDFYKVFVPAANGSGAIGEVLSTPMIGEPMIGSTETFLSVGKFETQEAAENCMKYIKTKFARAMLGTLKITQHNIQETWMNVPLQDFTSTSDIDWSKSVSEIDKQLYKKYNLSKDEIEFIESKVKSME
ncbi:MAG: Eco57I restriction-modification methylase domain-containing protein [Treponema sp.]|uniref:Eco57I restriction-modification methylase domain-containing protein n=1 Tax=Treponema sp. TaxID=166 RepID=UPI0025F2123B|nr:Eco57I restriction-modification methylase domain-containing protein [Treponema sp.]MBQ8678877.1 Eco57I restriction-modification methylase domain-containing protein [Treponema sp.]